MTAFLLSSSSSTQKSLLKEKDFLRGAFDARTNEMVVALASSSSSRSSLSSSNKVAFQRRHHHRNNRARHKIDRNSIASVSRSWTSRTSVSVPLRDLDPKNEDNSSKSSFSEYISDGSRILAVTFPDETRREQMTDTTWKVQVLNCV